MRKSLAADKPVDLNGFRQPGHHVTRQLAQKALEQELLVDGYAQNCDAAALPAVPLSRPLRLEARG